MTDSGLLASDRFEPAPYRQYKGDPKKAYWFFDEEMARAAVAFNGDRRPREKQMVTLVQDALGKGAAVVNQGGTTCGTFYRPSVVYPVRYEAL